MLKCFCKSVVEGRKIEIGDLKLEIDDEVLNFDIMKIESFFTDECWREVQKRGLYLYVLALIV